MKTQPFSVRLSPELVARINETAAREGVQPSTLAAEWLRERINHPPRALLAEAITVVIAALSEGLGSEEAAALVREHFLEGHQP